SARGTHIVQWIARGVWVAQITRRADAKGVPNSAIMIRCACASPTPCAATSTGSHLDSYEVGEVYEVSTELGSYLLAGRTAEPADGATPLKETLAGRHRLFGDRLRGWQATRPPAAIVGF